jgi:cytochrome P450
VQVATLRFTAESVDIGGVTIPAGEIVVSGLLAANRDPACTAQPDALDITREDNPHLAFGHGIHHCLGWKAGSRWARCSPASPGCDSWCPPSN